MSLVPPAGIEPALPKERDFESRASTNSARGALKMRNASVASAGDYSHQTTIGNDEFASQAQNKLAVPCFRHFV